MVHKILLISWQALQEFLYMALCHKLDRRTVETVFLSGLDRFLIFLTIREYSQKMMTSAKTAEVSKVHVL